MLRIIPSYPFDAEEIADLAREVLRQYYCPTILSEEDADFLWNCTSRADVIQNQMQRGVIFDRLELNGVNIGFMAYSPLPEQDILWLDRIYLLPAYHGQGIGAYALQHIKQVATQFRLREIFLYVFIHNNKAVEAFLKAGFEISNMEVSDGDSVRSFDSYLMRYALMVEPSTEDTRNDGS